MTVVARHTSGGGQAVLWPLYLYRGQWEVNTGTDQPGVVVQQLRHLRGCRPLTGLGVPAGSQQRTPGQKMVISLDQTSADSCDRENGLNASPFLFELRKSKDGGCLQINACFSWILKAFPELVNNLTTRQLTFVQSDQLAGRESGRS